MHTAGAWASASGRVDTLLFLHAGCHGITAFPPPADGGKEIAKHLAALSRTLKVNKGAAAWRRFVGLAARLRSSSSCIL